MAFTIRLPRLGESMKDGTVVKVLIEQGQQVGASDVIFEVETDKATVEIECGHAGVVKSVMVGEGEMVVVDQAMAVVGDGDEQISQEYLDALATEAKAIYLQRQSAGEDQDLATDIDLDAVLSSENVSDGKYTLGSKVKPSRMQRIVARRMVQSKQQIPCYYLSIEADVTELAELRGKLNGSGEVKISFNDFIIRAIAMGVKAYPIMAGQLTEGCIELREDICVGLAIPVGDSVVAPVVPDADGKSLEEVAAYRAALNERAKSNKLLPEDLEGACCTLSNLGPFGVDSFIPIVVPGQCSILGIGRITEVCVPDSRSEKGLKIRKSMNLTISVDHRIVNGADAAQFLDFVKKTLENPESVV